LVLAASFSTPQRYTHFGEAVILKKGIEYIYLEKHEASNLANSSFWLNLSNLEIEDHYMAGYLENINSKLEVSKRIKPE